MADILDPPPFDLDPGTPVPGCPANPKGSHCVHPSAEPNRLDPNDIIFYCCWCGFREYMSVLKRKYEELCRLKAPRPRRSKR